MASQKRIIVVGGGLGIGAHITDFLLHQYKAKVVVFGLDVSPAVEIWEKNNELLVVRGDATKPETIARARDAAVEYMGGGDSLVITLGVIGEIERVVNLDIESMRRTFEINFIAPVQLTQHFLPLLRLTHGTLLILSSAADRDICWSGWIPYACSKAALTRFVEQLGHEEKAVHVLGVYPGLTRTPMVTDLVAGKFRGKMDDDEVDEFIRRDREGEVEPPEWSANTVAKLAAGAMPVPVGGQGKVLWYNEIDPSYKDYKNK